MHWYVSIELPYNQGHRGPLVQPETNAILHVHCMLYWWYFPLVIMLDKYNIWISCWFLFWPCWKKIFGFHVLVFKYLSDKSSITVLTFIVKYNVLWCIFAQCSERIKFDCFCPAVDKRRHRVLVIIPPCWGTKVSSLFLYMDRMLPSSPQS